MRWVLVLLVGCYAATPPSGAPCDPAAPRCPRGQACLAGTCQLEGTNVVDAPFAGDATPVLRGCASDPDLAVCLSFDMPALASPLANEGALAIAATFANVSRTPLGTGGAAVFTPTSTMQFPPSAEITGIVALEATLRLDDAIAPMTRVGILDTDLATSGMSMFIYATATSHQISCTVGEDAVLADIDLPLGAWATIACSCEDNATVIRRDGVVLASAANCRPGTADTTGMQIGQNSRSGAMLPPNEPFTGAIDRVRLWTRLPQ